MTQLIKAKSQKEFDLVGVANSLSLSPKTKEAYVMHMASYERYCEENSLEIIRGVLSEPETYAVVLKETGKPVGSVGIMRKGHGSAPMGNSEAEIGYWIGVPYWGQGLIPEAVRELLRRCFEELSCTGVWCGYYNGNEKSKRVQEKCGFVYHHTERDKPCALMNDIRTEHFTYLTKDTWQNETKT